MIYYHLLLLLKLLLLLLLLADHHNMNKYYMNKYYTTIGRNMVWLLNPTRIVIEGITRFGHILMNSTVDAVDVDCDYFLVTSLS